MNQRKGERTIPFRERLSCTIAEACDATGLGRTKLYMLMSAGVITSTKVGRRRLINVQSLEQMFNRPKR